MSQLLMAWQLLLNWPWSVAFIKTGYCMSTKYTCDNDIFKVHKTNIWYTFIITRLPRKVHWKPTKTWEEYDLIEMKYIVPVDMHYETELAQKQLIFFSLLVWYWVPSICLILITASVVCLNQGPLVRGTTRPVRPPQLTHVLSTVTYL